MLHCVGVEVRDLLDSTSSIQHDGGEPPRDGGEEGLGAVFLGRQMTAHERQEVVHADDSADSINNSVSVPQVESV